MCSLVHFCKAFVVHACALEFLIILNCLSIICWVHAIDNICACILQHVYCHVQIQLI